MSRILLEVFLLISALALGMWAEKREREGKFPFEPRKPPMRRWRV